MATVFEAYRDGGVGSNAVGVLLGLERRSEYHIIVTVVGDNNVLISAVTSNVEMAGAVCVQFSNVPNGNIQFIGMCVVQHRRISWGGWRYLRHLGLGVFSRSRVQDFTGLLHVSTKGLGRSRSVHAGVLVSKTSP